MDRVMKTEERDWQTEPERLCKKRIKKDREKKAISGKNRDKGRLSETGLGNQQGE